MTVADWIVFGSALSSATVQDHILNPILDGYVVRAECISVQEEDAIIITAEDDDIVIVAGPDIIEVI